METEWKTKKGEIIPDHRVKWLGTGKEGKRNAIKRRGTIVSKIEHCDCGACDPEEAWGNVIDAE